MKNPPGFTPKLSSRGISGRMQYAPTRVRAKPAQFHISTHVPAKNAPDFTLPNKDIPKTCPVLGANPCRRTFRGVCFCALHGYVKNLAGFIPKSLVQDISGVCNTPLHGYVKNLPGFIFPHPNTPKTHPISPSPIGIHQKRTRF